MLSQTEPVIYEYLPMTTPHSSLAIKKWICGYYLVFEGKNR